MRAATEKEKKQLKDRVVIAALEAIESNFNWFECKALESAMNDLQRGIVPDSEVPVKSPIED